jgi:hypothetical protein
MVWMDVFGFSIVAEDKTGPATQSAVANADRLASAQSRVGDAVKGHSREMAELASGITHMGMTLMLAAPQLGSFGEIANQAGAALAFVGSGVSTVVPLIKTMHIILYGEMIPALMDYATALAAAYTAEIAVTGGLALVGAAIALWYIHTQRATTEQEKFTSSVKKTGDAYKDLNTLMTESQRIQDRLLGITGDIQQAQLDYQSAILDRKDAEDKLTQIGKEQGPNTREYERALISFQQAQMNETNAQKKVNDLTQEGLTLTAESARVATDTTKTRIAAARQARDDIGRAEAEALGYHWIFADAMVKVDQFLVDAYEKTANFLATPVQTGSGTTYTAPDLGAPPAVNQNITVNVNNPSGQSPTGSVNAGARALGNLAANMGVLP